MLKIFGPCYVGLRGLTNFMDHLIFVRKAYIPNFRPLVPFLHVKKCVVVGGWWVGVKTCILVLSCNPKLNNFLFIYLNKMKLLMRLNFILIGSSNK